MTTIPFPIRPKVCPECGADSSDLNWGPEGSRYEDRWVCECGGHGVSRDLVDADDFLPAEDDEPEASEFAIVIVPAASLRALLDAWAQVTARAGTMNVPAEGDLAYDTLRDLLNEATL